MRRITRRPLSLPPAEPLDEIYELAADARDIIRDQQRRELQDYTDTEESTARHEIPQIVIHNHQHSEPDLRESDTTVEIGPVHVKGLPKWAGVVIGLLVAVLTAAVAALLAR